MIIIRGGFAAQQIKLFFIRKFFGYWFVLQKKGEIMRRLG